MTKTYKYQWLMSELGIDGQCPFDECEGLSLTAFRWTYSGNGFPDSFKPMIVKDREDGKPPRRNSTNDYFKCSGCGLSMFNSKDAAIKHFRGLPPHNQKKLGYTHLAEGKLEPKHGVISRVGRNGHFDFFEYVDIQLEDLFNIVNELDGNP